MKKHLTDNLSLKIMSIVLAILVWFIVVNVDNPITTRTIDGVTIKVLNGNYIEEMGKSYSVTEGRDEISVSVTGKRSIVEKLDADDFTAQADLTQIINMDTDPIMVPITVTCSNSEVTRITPRTQAMAINIENMTSADFIISASEGDTRPARGYEVGELNVDPERITITGPESTINKIDNVVAQVDVSDMDSDSVLSAPLKIIDKNQDTMPDSETQYLRYSISDAIVDVQVVLWKVVSEISISADYSGRPASGYQVSEVTTTPSVISLAGSAEALAQLESEGNVLSIPRSVMDVAGESKDKEVKIDITEYLPDDVILPEEVSSSVIIRANILPVGSQEFQIQTSNIMVNNKPGGDSVRFKNEKLSIRIKGIEAELSNLSTDQIIATIDLNGQTEGEIDVPVTIQLPTGYELVENVTVGLVLEKTVDNTASNVVESTSE